MFYRALPLRARRFPAGVALLLLFAVPASARDDVRIVLEGGAVRPLAELGATFDSGERGLGQGDGFEIGVGLRVPVAEAWTLSPAFHYVGFGRHELEPDADEPWRTEAISFRTTAELAWCPPVRSGPLRPLVAIGGGLYRNRVVGYYDDPLLIETGERDDTVNSFGWFLRWGFRAADSVEVSFLAHRNTVRTWRYFETDAKAKYGWNNLAVRFSYLLPW